METNQPMQKQHRVGSLRGGRGVALERLRPRAVLRQGSGRRQAAETPGWCGGIAGGGELG
jgi:hypothetical protein